MDIFTVHCYHDIEMITLKTISKQKDNESNVGRTKQRDQDDIITT